MTMNIEDLTSRSLTLESEGRLTLNAHYRIESGSGLQFQRHCHSGYEIYYFLKGDVCYQVEGAQISLRPHSLLLLAPQVFHGVKVLSAAPYERYAVHFDPNLLSGNPEVRAMLLSPFLTCEQVHKGEEGVCYHHTAHFQIKQYIEQLMDCVDIDMETKASEETLSLKETAIKIRLEALLTQLLRIKRQSKEGTSAKNLNCHPVTARLIPYLNQNLANPLDLESLAREFFISKYYLNRIFKRDTGTTVMDYVIHKRAALARQYIQEGIKPGQSAQMAGFGDYSGFFRAYKKVYGSSPKEP